MATDPIDRKVPSNTSQWKSHVRVEKASGSITQLDSQEILSASRFNYKHFLGLRILWDYGSARRGLPAAITKQFRASTLRETVGWDAYLEQIDKPRGSESKFMQTSVPGKLASFSNVWQFQRHVITGDDPSEKVEEEIIVLTPKKEIRHRREEQNVTPSRHRPQSQSVCHNSIARELHQL